MNLVSIIVPIYNQAQYLDECLISVLNQTYPNWECLIIDDGSTDDSATIAQGWVNKDSRFKLFKKQNEGVAIARNFGISQAMGTWILPLDADDKINVNYLSEASKYFTNDVKLIYGKAEKFGSINSPWYLDPYSYFLLLCGNIIYVSALFRKSDFNQSQGYDPKLIDGLEDWDFYISFLNENDQVICINKTMFYYRIKNSSRNQEVHINKNKLQGSKQYILNKHKDTFDRFFSYNEESVARISHLLRHNSKLEKFYNSKRITVYRNILDKLLLLKKNQ